MFIEKLTNKEILEFVKSLDKKYHLRNKAFFTTFWDDFKILERNEEEIRILVAKDLKENLFEDDFEIVAQDFCFFSLKIDGDDAFDSLLDYYAFMYNKFGEQYLQSLKQHLIEEKNERIKEEVEEIEEEYKEAFTKINKKINKVKKIKKSNDIEEILENFKKDLERFPTVEEKVEYLKSFGFDVKVKKDNKNLEK